MKRFLLALSITMMFGIPSIAADPTPSPPPIILPDVRPAPNPPPASTPTTLAADQIYVIRANVPVVVLTSPQGLVKQTTDAGPIKIKAKFTDGDGTVQCRTYTDKSVISIEAVAAGQCEVMVVPVGDADPTHILRRTLSVLDSTPTPNPPSPPTPTDPLTTALQTAYSSEKDATSLALLQASYKTMAVNAPTTLKTNADAVAWMQANDPVRSSGKLAATRKAIAAELAASLGTSATAALDPTKFVIELTKISNALQGVKP